MTGGPRAFRGGGPADSILLHETYLSIQGESTFAGLPCWFIRTSRCNLRCRWCDSEFTFSGGTRRPVAEVVEEALASGAPLVEVTGGEPLLQTASLEVMRLLCDAGRTVLLETGGSLDVAAVDPRVRRIVDVKCPGSGEAGANRWTNLDLLTERDEVKFVLADRADYEWARTVVRERLAGRPPAILLSPVHGALAPADLVSWMLEDRLPARLNLQIHKVVWGDRRGV
ncbi:MAG: radical SAM protein [Planctomycetaceae bacterium]|nr:radical SAM protein [Planctomycetota bacterium]NUN53580.1 radical SAM protein [Planctomycetaceae bacterium]